MPLKPAQPYLPRSPHSFSADRVGYSSSGQGELKIRSMLASRASPVVSRATIVAAIISSALGHSQRSSAILLSQSGTDFAHRMQASRQPHAMFSDPERSCPNVVGTPGCPTSPISTA